MKTKSLKANLTNRRTFLNQPGELEMNGSVLGLSTAPHTPEWPIRRGGDDLEDDFVGSGSDETDGESAESDSEGPEVGVDQGAGHEASKKGVRFEEVSNILNHKRTDHENAGSLSPIQWNRPSALRTAMRARVRKSLSTQKLTQRRTRVTILFRSRSGKSFFLNPVEFSIASEIAHTHILCHKKSQCPSTNKQLLKLFRGRSSRQRGVIVDRLLKSFALPLNPSVNRPILAGLLSTLLGRFDRIADSSTPYWAEVENTKQSARSCESGLWLMTIFKSLCSDWRASSVCLRALGNLP